MNYLNLLLAAALALTIALPVSSEAANIFTLGNDDGATGEFSQENGTQPAPGAADVFDDDYYFAGTYGIGVVAVDEDWKNFDRAITNGDPTNRIHFNLADADIINQELTLTVDLFAGGWWDAVAGAGGGTFGTHDVSINFNGTNILTQDGIVADTFSEVTFSPASVNAVAGENVIEITRTGGDSKGDGGNAGWIQFDYITLESNPAADPAIIQTFTSNKDVVSGTSPTATLSWQVNPDPAIKLSIDNDIGDVTALTSNGSGSIEIRISESTTYTLTATDADGSETATVSISFEAYAELWRIGADDASQAEFSQENGPQSAPGSPTVFDDDFYLAGTYPDPVGVVEADENLKNFDRAIANNDPANRIHFNLGALEAAPESQLRLTVDLQAGGWWDAVAAAGGEGYGTHDVSVDFNGTNIYSQSGIVADTTVELEFSGDDVGANEGANIIEITRTGGDSKGDGGNAGWIQFDYLSLESDISAVPLTDPISAFSASKELIQPGQAISLDWRVDPTAQVSIDQGIGNVDAQTINGVGSLQIAPTANTTYTLTSVRGGETETATLTVTVDLALSFAGNVTTVTPEAPTARLTWSVDPNPDVTVSIDNNIGDVTAITADGRGFIDVSPTATTTYTLTATRPNTPEDDTEISTATVEFSLVYSPLWVIGEDDGTQAEFSQENGSQPAPGSPFAFDDDFYLAGNYPDSVGLVEADEIWKNLDRAIATNDPTNRIHFNLDAQQSLPASGIRLTVDLIAGGWWDAVAGAGGEGYGTHDISINFNGNNILTKEGIEADTVEVMTFSAADVDAVAGENIIEITRTGGDSKGDGGNAGWIQFDYIAADISLATGGIGPFLITDFRYDQTLNQLALTFPSTAGQFFMIETSNDLGTWLEYDDSVSADAGDTTTYIIQLTGNEPDPFFVRAQRLQP
ncbi:MAG: hypothetical protein VYB61_09665 [Verrucomicrobiota bacterium]|nr:hypothetical protein [Verrucomicrobiota bacterium]